MSKNKFLIMGFSGSGKSTCLKRLQELRPDKKDEFIDLDETVEKKLGQTILATVKNQGWEHFRQIENQILEELLHSSRVQVISLGGGSVAGLRPWQMSLLTSFEVIWLDVSFSDCWRRIEHSLERPLVQLGKIEVEKIYQERRQEFERIANKRFLHVNQAHRDDLALYILNHLG